jgi:hypothetical protein
MNFEEATACFCFGFSFLIMTILCMSFSTKEHEYGFSVAFLGAAIFGAPLWCIIVGIHYML